jgi:hypothetical protein
MKKKNLLMTVVAILGLSTITSAQVPNYVPTNGLVGWWPFNGNANDESGNGNNGTVNGATLTSDRFGNSNKAYLFNNNSIYLNSTNFALTQFSMSAWFNTSAANTNYASIFSHFVSTGGNNFTGYWIGLKGDSACFFLADGTTPGFDLKSSNTYNDGNWHLITGTYSSGQAKLYVDGILQNSSNYFINLLPSVTEIGNDQLFEAFYGKIDDIGYWNRALTQQEITDLYNACIFANNTIINPQSNSLTTGSTATFTATTSDPNPSYIWQSNFGQGFQTLNNFGNYNGTNTGTLNIANVQLPNHTQPIRVITTSGNCIDTSNVAVINILDTCIVTVYDTLLTTVTDTLVINTQITGINPPNNLNTLKVFPNPASTHITIDYGNFNAMSGYTLTIVNAIGQTVFTTPINQQMSYIDLSTWTGNGIYFVQLIDPQNNTIENRKIVIQ